jgi:hypothetical protein
MGGDGGNITLQTGPCTEGIPGLIKLVTHGLERGGDISLQTGERFGGSLHLLSSGAIVIQSPDVTSQSSSGPLGTVVISTNDANKSSGTCTFQF